MERIERIKSCSELMEKLRGRREGTFTFTESFRLDFERFAGSLEQLEKENFELKQREIIHKLEVKPKDNFYEYYDFIPKSVIREKIEELEQDGFCTENDLYKLNREDRYKGNCVKICKNYCVCKVLKELLGDEQCLN